MSYDTFQQVFSLSVALNKVTAMKGTQENLQKSLKDTVSKQLEQLGEGWELAWGPVASKAQPDNPDTVPDEAWFVARHPGCAFQDMKTYETFVVAVAGTTYASSRDWLNKSLAVHSVVDVQSWAESGVEHAPVDAPHVAPDRAYISSGIANKVHTIMKTPSPDGAKGRDKTLLEFLAEQWIASRKQKIIFTGFQLGGALAPTLAFAFLNWDGLPRTLRSAVDVLVYPIAGPSPGNAAFAKAFASLFRDYTHYAQRGAQEADETYHAWNCNIVNSLDIVPQAWSISAEESPSQNLHNIPAIYGKPTLPEIDIAANMLSIPPLLSRITYAPLQSKILKGVPRDVVPRNAHEWVEEAWRQYDVREYAYLFGLFTKTEEEKIEEKREKALGHPVIGNMTWIVDNPELMKAAVPQEKRWGSVPGVANGKLPEDMVSGTSA